MKYFMLLAVYILSFAAFGQKYCHLEAFGNEYSGEGRTVVEAKVRARISCSENNDPMFCNFDDAVCMSDPDPMNFYCEIEASNKLYYEFSFSKRNAVNKAISKCRRNHSTIFCEREDVTCYSL